MKKNLKYILILVISLFMICGINKVEAKNIDFNRNVYVLDEVSKSDNNKELKNTEKTGCAVFKKADGSYGNTHKYLKWGITLIRYLAPVLVVIFGLIDFLGALFSGEEKNMKDAQKRALTRLIAAIILLIIPALLKLVVSFSSIFTDIGSDDIFCGLI